MSSVADPTETTATSDFTRTWRYKLGLFMIVVGNLVMIAGGVLLGAMGVLGAATVGALVVGGEIVSLASIVFLGKEGFMAIKNKVVAAAKSTYTQPVGRTRHRIGIVLLLTSVFTTYLMLIYAWDAFAVATADGSGAPVWGLNIDEQGSLVFYLFLAGELSFLVSIYVLGADWWGKFRRLFVWESLES